MFSAGTIGAKQCAALHKHLAALHQLPPTLTPLLIHLTVRWTIPLKGPSHQLDLFKMVSMEGAEWGHMVLDFENL
jgi:hypothetical protein